MTACANPAPANNAAEETVLQFLKNVYSSTEADVKQYEQLRNYFDDLAKSSTAELVEIDDDNAYIVYLKDKFKISDNCFEKLLANRQADYYIVKSYQSGVLYSAQEIELTYDESMHGYRYRVLVDDDELEGLVRLEDGEIAAFEINF